MELVFNVRYTGSPEGIRSFLDSVVGDGILDKVRSEDGNLCYAYYLPADGSSELLLVERWRDEDALEAHGDSENMRAISALKSENGLESKVERLSPLR